MFRDRKEERIRLGNALREFLSNEHVKSVLDAFLKEAETRLLSAAPDEIEDLRDGAYQLRARQDFLRALQAGIHDGLLAEAETKRQGYT